MILNIKDSDVAHCLFTLKMLSKFDICFPPCSTSSFLLTSFYQPLPLSHFFPPQTGPFFRCHAALPLVSLMPTCVCVRACVRAWCGTFQAVVTAEEWGCMYKVCVIITTAVKPDGRCCKCAFLSLYMWACVYLFMYTQMWTRCSLSSAM